MVICWLNIGLESLFFQQKILQIIEKEWMPVFTVGDIIKETESV